MTAIERLQAAADAPVWSEVPSRDGDACVEVAPEDWHAIVAALRDGCGFETVVFLTAIDRTPATPRFEVNVALLSLDHADRIRVRARLPEDDPAIATITDLFPGASFMERECFDMFGVRFDGHPDLRRLLMPEGYTHHPLRKEFPHQGIEPDRLYREWDRGRRAEGAQR